MSSITCVSSPSLIMPLMSMLSLIKTRLYELGGFLLRGDECIGCGPNMDNIYFQK